MMPSFLLLAISPSRSEASDQQTDEEEWTLQSLGKYVQSIPTKKLKRISNFMSPDSYKQEMQVIKCDLQGSGERVDEVECQCADISSCVQDHHTAIQYLGMKTIHHI